MARPTLRNFEDFLIISQSEDDGEGILIGEKQGSGDIMIATYTVADEAKSIKTIIIPEKLFGGFSQTILNELITRHRKCLENSSSPIKS